VFKFLVGQGAVFFLALNDPCWNANGRATVRNIPDHDYISL